MKACNVHLCIFLTICARGVAASGVGVALAAFLCSSSTLFRSNSISSASCLSAARISERGREERKEGRRDGGKEGEMEGGREGGREGRKKGRKERWREGVRERGEGKRERKGSFIFLSNHFLSTIPPTLTIHFTAKVLHDLLQTQQQVFQ